MAKHPFRPPDISPAHQKLLDEIANADPEYLQNHFEKIFNKFKKTEATRYKEASGFHCCYCGEKRDRLDLDHFRPKGQARFETPDDDLLDYYKFLATGHSPLPGAVKRKRNKESYFKPFSSSESFAHQCIEPNNIIPSCPDCNTGGTNLRDAFDTPCKFGKSNRFPIDPKKIDQPLLLNPSDEQITWKALLSHFKFIDLTDTELNPSGSGGLPAWGGAIRCTIVVPNFDAANSSDAENNTMVKAATIIEVFGLNRKALSEQRFRIRQTFSQLIPRLPEKLDSDTFGVSLTALINKNPEIIRAAYAIRAFISESPHKLALLDVLRTWLGGDLFNQLDLDRFVIANR